MTTIKRNQPGSIAAVRAALPEVFQALARFMPMALPITEREYIARVLNFTSWDGQDLDQLAALGCPVLFGADLANRKTMQALGLHGSTDEPWPEVSPERANFLWKMLRRQLADHIAGVHRHDFGQDIYPQMLKLPANVASPRGCGAGEIYLPANLQIGIAYALAVLFDPERGLGDFVNACELKGCGGYFLRSGKSGKPAKYHDACRLRLRAKSRHIARRRATNK